MMFHFITVYAVLFFLGFGFARCVTEKISQIAIAPIFGYCIISVLSTYFLYFDFNRYYLIPSLGVFTLISLYLTWQTKIEYQWKNFPFVALFVFTIIYIRLNNYVDGELLFSINPDIAAYMSSGDWLTKLMPLTSLMGGAKYEVLHAALRWGFSSNLSVFSLLTKEPSFTFLFPICAIVLFSGVWTAVELFNEHYRGFSNLVKQVVIALIGINAGILYLIYEGFYPNVIGLSILTILCILLIQKENKKALVAGVLLIAGLISSYSEIFIIFVLVAGIYTLFDVIKYRVLFSLKISYIVLMCLAGVLLVLPLSLQILKFTIANISNMKNVGYPQPTWIGPSDLVGLSNIFSNFQHYLNSAPHVIGRFYFYLGFTILLSIWVLYELIKERSHKLLGAVIISLLIIFSYNYYKYFSGVYPPVNYLYDKIALILAPVLGLFFYKSIARNKYKLMLACLFTIISTFLFLSPFNLKYRGQMYFDEMKFIINKFENKDVVLISNQRGQRVGKDIGQLRYVDRAQDIIWGEYTNKMLDQWDPNTCVNFKPIVPIYLVAQKISLINAAQVKNKVFETKHYIVLDTKKMIENICSKHSSFKSHINLMFVR